MAKRTQGEQVWVWLDDPSFGPLQRIGTLCRGDRGSVRFAYDPAWLRQAHAFPLDPELDLTAGEFFRATPTSACLWIPAPTAGDRP